MRNRVADSYFFVLLAGWGLRAASGIQLNLRQNFWSGRYICSTMEGFCSELPVRRNVQEESG